MSLIVALWIMVGTVTARRSKSLAKAAVGGDPCEGVLDDPAFRPNDEAAIDPAPGLVNTDALVFEAKGECSMASGTRRCFPESFKRQAVGRVGTSGLPICRVMTMTLLARS